MFAIQENLANHHYLFFCCDILSLPIQRSLNVRSFSGCFLVSAVDDVPSVAAVVFNNK
jgi:hypothetical protein